MNEEQIKEMEGIEIFRDNVIGIMCECGVLVE